MFIGDDGLKMRSMFMKRSGRPRSKIKQYVLTITPPAAPKIKGRASASLPRRRAAKLSSDDAPANPPAKMYVGILSLQSGGLTGERP